jgi:putative addiction module component (TIGR02574 family)
MGRSLAEIEREATQLPVEERARLIANLIASLEPIEEGDVAAAWEQEVEARSASFHRGEAKTVPAREALERARRNLR